MMWEWAKDRLKKKTYVNVMMRCEVCGRCYVIGRHLKSEMWVCPECGNVMVVKDISTYPVAVDELVYAGRCWNAE